MSRFLQDLVPRLLTPDQKLTRPTLSQAKLAIFEADQASFLDRFLTQDERWVHHFEPETKRQLMQWKHPGSPSKDTSLDDSRARAYCACSRWGGGLYGHFFSHLSFLFSFSLSLGDGLI